MLQKMLIAAALVVGATAHANTGGMQSEFFFQTEAGKSDLTPKIGYRMLTEKTKAPGAEEEKTNGMLLGVAYEYGINEMFAVEFALDYENLEKDSNPKTKESGLADPTLALKGTSAMSWGRLRYGGLLGMSLEKAKVETNGDVNTASGGWSLAPYIGADMDAGGGILGGRAMYVYRMDRTVDSGGTDVKYKGGDTLGLSVFYEHFFADMLLGGAVNYRSIAETKNKDTDVVGEESHNLTGIAIYSRMPMGSWALIPALNYDFTHSEMDKWDDITLSVAARFGF